MRCRDAKYWLTAQRDSDTDLTQSEVTEAQEHLGRCSPCYSYERRQQRLDSLLPSSAPRSYPNVSTERIMRAVEQQRRITQQLESLQAQQQARLVRVGKVGRKLAGMMFGLLVVFTLGLLYILIFQPDLFVTLLSSVSGIFDVVYWLAQYLQVGLTFITRENWLLSGVALAVVVMMGIWLRLMRYPQEA